VKEPEAMEAGRINRKHAWLVAAVCACAFLVSAGLRLPEAGRWDRPEFSTGGERLLATNDAYFWVAGAEGRNSVAQSMPLAVLLRIGSALLGRPPAALAFWGAAVLAGLVAIPLALWCFELGAPFAALFAPLFVTLAPAFYNRTRLGYYDSDWAALFFPLLLGWLAARWLAPRLRAGRWSAMGDEPAQGTPWLTAAIILLAAFARPWHAFIGLYTLAMLGLAGALLLALGRPANRAQGLLALLAAALAAGWGWIGAAIGLLLWWAGRGSALLGGRRATAFMAGALALVLLLATGLQFQEYLVDAAETYLGRLFGGAGAGPQVLELSWPPVSASVREMQDAGLFSILEGAAFHPLAGLLGAAGFCLLCVRRPATALLLPLLGLGLAAAVMGIRFTMFAAPPLALGLLVPLEWGAARLWRGRGWRLAHLAEIGALAGFGALLLLYLPTARLPVESVLGEGHARALIELGEMAPPGAMAWTWWDYGYAAQHFAGLETFADGRRNSGEYLFTLGSVLGAPTVERSAALMRFTAGHEYIPWAWWLTWSEAEFEAWLADPQGALPAGAGPQYLVLAWDGLAALPWIEYYAGWDFGGAGSARASAAGVLRPEALDLETGAFTFDGGRVLLVAAVDVLAADGVQHYDYPANSGGPFLLLNDASGAVMLLDAQAYGSTFVRLLTSPAGEAGGEHFELLLDRLPAARVFRLR